MPHTLLGLDDRATIESSARAPRVPEGITADDVADACRRAALAFCRGASAGWTKRDLAEWLVGMYEDAALSVGESMLPPPMEMAAKPSRPPLDEHRILGVVDPAWQEAVTCVEDFARGAESRHLDEALHRGSIVEAWTEDGDSMFVPVNRAGLPLAVRVRSLLVVDFLLRPEDYEGDIRVCGECSVVLLGQWTRNRGHCEEHIRRSDVGPTVSALEDLPDALAPSLLRVRR